MEKTTATQNEVCQYRILDERRVLNEYLLETIAKVDRTKSKYFYRIP
jgi:hypothetical protein